MDDLRHERLTERDRGAFQDAAAFEARRIFFAGANPIERVLHRLQATTAHAQDLVDGAVNFDDARRGIAGGVELEAGPGDPTDNAGRDPSIVKELLAYAEAARDDLGDSLTSRVGKNVRPAGKP